MKSSFAQNLSFYFQWKNVVVLSAILAGVVLWFGSEGVRGTDQYWYLGDVQTLAEQKPALTNIVYRGNYYAKQVERERQITLCTMGR